MFLLFAGWPIFPSISISLPAWNGRGEKTFGAANDNGLMDTQAFDASAWNNVLWRVL